MRELLNDFVVTEDVRLVIEDRRCRVTDKPCIWLISYFQPCALISRHHHEAKNGTRGAGAPTDTPAFASAVLDYGWRRCVTRHIPTVLIQRPTQDLCAQAEPTCLA